MNLRTRRGALSAAGLFGTGLALAACGGDAASGGAAAPAASSGPVKLVYWGAFAANLGKVQEEVVKQFNDSQKTVTVEHQFQGSYEELANKLTCLLYTSPSPRDRQKSRMPSSA